MDDQPAVRVLFVCMCVSGAFDVASYDTNFEHGYLRILYATMSNASCFVPLDMYFYSSIIRWYRALVYYQQIKRNEKYQLPEWLLLFGGGAKECFPKWFDFFRSGKKAKCFARNFLGLDLILQKKKQYVQKWLMNVIVGTWGPEG